MVCRYSERGGFAISGDRNRLRDLASDIRRVHERPLRRALSPADPSPYDKSISALVVIASAGPLKIREVDGECRIEGGIHQLTLFAENLDFLAASSDAEAHLHIEYHQDHFYLDASAEPLVVQVNED